VTAFGIKTGPLLSGSEPEPVDVADLPATTGEGLGAALAESFQGSLGPLAFRFAQRQMLDPGRMMTPEEATQRYGIGDLKFDAPISETSAAQMSMTKRDTLRREDIVRRSQLGLAGRLGAGLVGATLDPLNIAAAVFPELLLARFAAAPATATGALGALRTGAQAVQAAREGSITSRTLAGAGEGAVGSALVTPGTYALSQAEGRDYSVGDAFLDVAFGTALGAGLHAGIGAFKARVETGAKMPPIEQAMQDAGPQVRIDTLRSAVSDVMEDRPVGVGEIVHQVYQDYAAKEFDRLLWSADKLSDDETAALSRLSKAEAAGEAPSLTSRIAELEQERRALGAEKAEAEARAAPDEVTTQRLDAIETELKRPDIPAPRRADLEAERQMLTEGASPDAALEQLRAQAEATGLGRALGRTEKELGSISAKRDRAAVAVDRANAEFEATSGRLALRQSVVQALAERTVRRAAGRAGVTADPAEVAAAARNIMAAPPDARAATIRSELAKIAQSQNSRPLPQNAAMQRAMSQVTQRKAEPFYDPEDLDAARGVDDIAAAAPLPKARASDQGIGAVTRDTQELDEIDAELDEQIRGLKAAGALSEAEEASLSEAAIMGEEAQAIGKARDLAAVCLSGVLK
jgi:hypothetical protein